MRDYREFNETLTKELVQDFEKKGVGPGVKKRHQDTANIIEKHFNKKDYILEIGCRVGHLFDVLKGRGYKNFYGIDISDYSIKQLHKNNYQGERNDAQNFSLNKEFDAVIISHCLEHCPEPEKVIENIHSHLKMNGKLYVEVPQQPKEQIPTIWAHYYCFESLAELKGFFPEDKWKLLFNEKLICVFEKIGD